MEERGHILNVLEEVRNSLKKEDFMKIKNLSNEVMHASSINQDPDVISVAVIIYSLSKIIQRENYQTYKNWPKFYKDYILGLNRMIDSLKKNDINKFRQDLDSIRNNIQNLSGNLKIYIADVFRKARINKASKIYEHGISMEKTAKILGISVWELSEYAGQSNISDIDLSVTLPIKDRLKIVEEVFS